jgi:hypothetical protein
MLPGALRQNDDTRDDESADDSGGDRPAESKASVVHRLVEEIADRGAERPRQDEGRPEQKDARHIGHEIDRDQRRQPGGKYQRAAVIAEPGLGGPIAERGAERLREGNGDPVEGLGGPLPGRIS